MPPVAEACQGVSGGGIESGGVGGRAGGWNRTKDGQSKE